MNIQIDESEAEALFHLKRMLKQAATPTPIFLHWVADRLTLVHGDVEQIDFVQKLREYAREITSIQALLKIERQS